MTAGKALSRCHCALACLRLFRTKSIDELIAATEEPSHRLQKTLGPWSLAFLGIGIVIGSGIFTVTGTAAAGQVRKIPSLFKATGAGYADAWRRGRRHLGTARRRTRDHRLVPAGRWSPASSRRCVTPNWRR